MELILCYRLARDIDLSRALLLLLKTFGPVGTWSGERDLRSKSGFTAPGEVYKNAVPRRSNGREIRCMQRLQKDIDFSVNCESKALTCLNTGRMLGASSCIPLRDNDA